MMRATAGLKAAVAVAAAVLFLTFGNLSLSLLLPEMIGVALVLFGIIIGYRPAAVLGLFVCLCVAALSIEISTLVDIDVWQTSVLGLLLPTSLLAWSALLSEDADIYDIHLRTAAFGSALAVAILLAVAVPVSVALIGFALPSAASTISTMAEISILFTIIAATALLAMRPMKESASAGRQS